jgi:hypothetical protein
MPGRLWVWPFVGQKDALASMSTTTLLDEDPVSPAAGP